MDAAFFQRDVLRLLAARRCAYAIKVGYWSWLPLKQLAAEWRQWHALAPDVTGFEHQLVLPPWNLRLRVMIYRKHVQHESPKNFQLDLFTPDDGHFEYYAVATNLDAMGRRLRSPRLPGQSDQEERQDECDEGPRITSFGCRRRIASTRWTLGHPRFRTRSRSAPAMTISKQARMTMGVVDRLIA